VRENVPWIYCDKNNTDMLTIHRYAKILRRLPRAISAISRHGISFGYCQVCERRTGYVQEQSWHREYYRCLRCFSSARMRSFMLVLETEFPDWSSLSIHESSPSGPVTTKLSRNCARYSVSCYFDDVPPGSMYQGRQCENLECLTFDDSSFDLFITQDVFEHVLNPQRAFAEIARVLKPGGAHVFTVPWLASQRTESRVVMADGKMRCIKEPVHHGSPTDPGTCLVITDWGSDMIDLIHSSSGLKTEVFSPASRELGVVGEGLEVFVSRRSAYDPRYT
jgi:SAM-dependent methyltransferase